MFKYFYYSFIFLIFSIPAFAVKQKTTKQQTIAWAKTIAVKTNTQFDLNYYSGLSPLKYKKAIIIASSSGHISSFNKKTAWRNWTKTIKKESFYFSKLYKNTLYLGSLSGNIFAFDLISKKILWKKRITENALYKAIIYNKQLLLLSEKGQLWSVHRLNSQVLWSKKIFTTDLNTQILEVKSQSKDNLSIYKNKLYIKHLSKVFAFNLKSKKIQWQKKYKKSLKIAKSFSQPIKVWLMDNKKQYLAGDVLKEKSFIYLYTQSNALIKTLLK